MNSIEPFLRVLNEALKADPHAVNAIVGHRVPCNSALGDHLTIQVMKSDDTLKVGALGIINGICLAATGKAVAAVFDDKGRILEFTEHKP